jgi:hypothetical protein
LPVADKLPNGRLCVTAKLAADVADGVKVDPCGRRYVPVNGRSAPKADIAFEALVSDGFVPGGDIAHAAK